MMITVTAEQIEKFQTLLKNEEFPREALEFADLDSHGVLRIVMRSLGTSRAYLATLQLTTLQEV